MSTASAPLIYKWAGYRWAGFPQPLCDSPQLSFSNLPGPVASFRSYASRIFFEIMISKVVVSSLLLAALANGLVIKRE